MKLGIDTSKFPGQEIPVIFRANLRDPSTFFASTKFPMQDRDIIYVTNSQAGADAARAAESAPVLFEDADRRGFDDTELFHVINSVRQHGKTLLMTSRQWPAAWPVTLPDLRSRLKAVTVVETGEPDEGLLAQVLMKLFADRQLYMDDKLIGYIVNRMERSLDTAQTIVDRIDRLALSRGTRITRPLAAEVLNAMDSTAVGEGLDGD